MLVMRSVGNTHRVWKNEAAEETTRLEAKGASLEELFAVVSGENAKRMFDKGDVAAGLMACGQGIGLVTDIKPAAEIVQDLLKEAANATGRLSGLNFFS